MTATPALSIRRYITRPSPNTTHEQYFLFTANIIDFLKLRKKTAPYEYKYEIEYQFECDVSATNTLIKPSKLLISLWDNFREPSLPLCSSVEIECCAYWPIKLVGISSYLLFSY